MNKYREREKLKRGIFFKTEPMPAGNGDYDQWRKMTNETLLRLLHAKHNEQRLICFHL